MMIAFGGVIGTGLFVASGDNLSQAGPLGALISYAVGALIIYTVMLSLGELSSYFPNGSSFGEYAHNFISPSVGYVVVWLYWLNWIVAIGSEFTAIGFLMQRWFPYIDVWVFALIFGIIIFLLNIFTVKLFAEGEFIFSFVKVIAVIAFLIIGVVAIVHKLITHDFSFSYTFANFYKDGVFPHGLSAVLMVILAVTFAFSGTESIGVAIGETKNPQKVMPSAINATLWRLAVFFIGSVFVIATLLPSSEAAVTKSPFVSVLSDVGIPYAADIMNFVIIMAIFSVANSGLWASSRMLFTLSKKKTIPAFFGKTTKRGIPIYGVIFSMIGGILALLSKIYEPESVFLLLINVSGFATLIAWMAISLSQLNFRRKFVREGGDIKSLPYKTPFMPYTPIIAIILCLAAIVGSFFDVEQRYAIYATIGFSIVCLIGYFAQTKFGKKDRV
ncbi:amino acid permease [Helicobacter sp. 11S02629-2]|uniref:amino acid permease n=1 Tax=Helicobacter sp. 11S02629-2 TaxID=1476195 RepID=UPI000BA7BD2C|nr:amino acid permease [Helicobacter sp. 11S02629-2]PAF45399.1 amino acid permease [Helicobacter sp. 11S02629-2]